MMKADYEMKMTVEAKSVNESFCRAVIGAFASRCDPSLSELADLKTAVSEAVTNCIVHAYGEKNGLIYITAGIYNGNTVKVKIRDKGCGIENIRQAREPLFTTGGSDRSGLGFSVMECFSDSLKVTSVKNKGTAVTITKIIKGRSENETKG